MQAGWRSGTAGTSRCHPLPYPATVGDSFQRPGGALFGDPAGGVTADSGPRSCPVLPATPELHAGARAGPRVAAPGDLDSAFPRGDPLLPHFASCLHAGEVSSPLVSHITSSGQQRPRSCCHHSRVLSLAPPVCQNAPTLPVPSCLHPRSRLHRSGAGQVRRDELHFMRLKNKIQNNQPDNINKSKGHRPGAVPMDDPGAPRTVPPR